MKFLPGPGLGGHCIPIDPTYLSWKMKALNFPARFIELATELNSQMPVHVVRKVGDILNEDRLAVNGARVLILGVAYKANVSDMRESPAIEIAEQLLQKGAQVDYHDPHVPEFQVGAHALKSVELSDEVLDATDLVVVVTDHEAVDYERVVARSQRVFDTRNATRSVRRGREKIRKL
jgi:UDP-N-acetyl-D-glucosamine dehydrogenase